MCIFASLDKTSQSVCLHCRVGAFVCCIAFYKILWLFDFMPTKYVHDLRHVHCVRRGMVVVWVVSWDLNNFNY